MSTKRRLNEIDQMLVQKAINRAKAKWDTYNESRYQRMLGNHLTICERTDLNVYLFGDSAGVPVSVLQGLP
jgi:phage gp36-like protein